MDPSNSHNKPTSRLQVDYWACKYDATGALTCKPPAAAAAPPAPPAPQHLPKEAFSLPAVMPGNQAMQLPFDPKRPSKQ